jgi:mRNA interferase HicA
MKRIDLIRHFERYGVQLLREGGSHSVYVNRSSGKTSTVPAIERSMISSLTKFAKI